MEGLYCAFYDKIFSSKALLIFLEIYILYYSTVEISQTAHFTGTGEIAYNATLLYGWERLGLQQCSGNP